LGANGYGMKRIPKEVCGNLVKSMPSPKEAKGGAGKKTDSSSQLDCKNYVK
jgi:hypothetical protein